MGLKEKLAEFFHLDKSNRQTNLIRTLNSFYLRPDIVHYDFAQQAIEYTGNYEDLIRDMNQRGKYVQLDIGDDHMDLGVLFTRIEKKYNQVEQEYFFGQVKRYGITFNEGTYISNENNLPPSIHIDNYGFEEFDYVDYVDLLKRSISI